MSASALAEGADRDCGPEGLDTLASVEDGRYEQLQVLSDRDSGVSVLQRATIPRPVPSKLDEPERLVAFPDVVRWDAVTSADSMAMQAPFRSEIAIEDYQPHLVARALRMPRVNLLIADDVGLGRTIEAGLGVQKLLLRHRSGAGELAVRQPHTVVTSPPGHEAAA